MLGYLGVGMFGCLGCLGVWVFVLGCGVYLIRADGQRGVVLQRADDVKVSTCRRQGLGLGV